ncbi:MAG: phage tail sheath subtilisin-like domain-containing protein [Paracoccaceae bacterium]
MPERLAPGAHVAHVGFAVPRIAAAATTTAFVGPTSRGPVFAAGDPSATVPLTSLADFERLHGKARTLRFGDVEAIDHTALAVRAFFANGGSRLRVARVAGEGAATASSGDALGGPGSGVALVARDPGGGAVGGRTGVAVSVRLREDARTLAKRDALRTPGAMLLHAGALHVVGAGSDASPGAASALAALDDAAQVSLLSLAIEIADDSGIAFAASDLGHDPRHPRFVGRVLGPRPPVGAGSQDSPVELRIADGVGPFELRRALVGADGSGRADVALADGSDGSAPPPVSAYREALEALLALEDVTVVAAPASAAAPEGDAVRRALAEHAGTDGRRFAVLDPPPRAGARRVRRLAEGLEARSAALYHPWIEVEDPSATGTVATPPSGAVCGLYARVDAARGVWKPPAGEPLTGVAGVARRLGRRKRAALTQSGVNPIRAFRRRGVMVWGARTLSSDPEWRYVSVRRHFLHLRASIERGLGWVGFEANGQPLWDRVRAEVSDVLNAEWRAGGLAGFTPDRAFFVRCGPETTTPEDLAAGRVVCEVGFAPLKPAEFVVFRVALRTAEATV